MKHKQLFQSYLTLSIKNNYLYSIKIDLEENKAILILIYLLKCYNLKKK